MAIRILIFLFLICGLLFSLSVFISDIVRIVGFPANESIKILIISSIGS